MALAGTCVVLAACGSTPSTGGTSPTASQQPVVVRTPSITLQHSQPAGSVVRVDRVYLPGSDAAGSTGGIVAVCADAGGHPGTCDAYTEVADGTSAEVSIYTPTPLVAGPYIVGLYAAHGLPAGEEHPLATAQVQLG